MTTPNIPAPGSPHTSQEHTTAQRYRDNTHRLLADGCEYCNESKVACDAKLYVQGDRCCPVCAHP